MLFCNVLEICECVLYCNLDDSRPHNAGPDPGFQVRRGALKKIVPSGGRREHFWGISCEKSRFYANKIIFLPILGGRAPGAPPPPESAPACV